MRHLMCLKLFYLYCNNFSTLALKFHYSEVSLKWMTSHHRSNRLLPLLPSAYSSYSFAMKTSLQDGRHPDSYIILHEHSYTMSKPYSVSTPQGNTLTDDNGRNQMEGGTWQKLTQTFVHQTCAEHSE